MSMAGKVGWNCPLNLTAKKSESNLTLVKEVALFSSNHSSLPSGVEMSYIGVGEDIELLLEPQRAADTPEAA